MFTPRIWPWLNRPPPIPSFEKGLLKAPPARQAGFSGHSHVYQNQPFPGAPAYAWESLGLVEFSPIGWGTMNRDHFDPLPRAMPWFAGLAVKAQGVGGLSQGQWINQPLLYDPSLQSEDLSLNPFTVT